MKTTVACILMMAPASSTTLLICIRRTAYGGFPLRWPRSFEQNFRVAKWIVGPGVKLPCGAAADRSRLDPGCGRQERREVALRCRRRCSGQSLAVLRRRLHRRADRLLVLDGSPEALDEDVVSPCALAVHADRDAVVNQHAGEFGTGELTE